MIKCPNCGSTAQVKLILVKYDRDEYKCGCGCRFFRKAFTEKVIKIFPEGE